MPTENAMKTLNAAIAAGLLAAAPAFAAPVLLDFELPANASFGSILEYYNGGQDQALNVGPDLGVSFSGDALALIGEPTVVNQPSGVGVMYPFSALATTVMNVDFAFTGLSFFYSSTSALAGAVKVWSGANGTGTEIASFDLLANAQANGCSGADFCNFGSLGLAAFADARSVTFAGTDAAFDNIAITPIPEPSTYALMALGLAGLAAAARRNKKG
jgi:hypothetical protein